MVACYYFRILHRESTRVASMLLSLVVQVARTLEVFPPILNLFRTKYSDGRSTRTASVSELCEVLLALLAASHDTFVVLDALDECMEGPLLLTTINSLIENSVESCRWFFTSRPQCCDIGKALGEQSVNTVTIQGT